MMQKNLNPILRLVLVCFWSCNQFDTITLTTDNLTELSRRQQRCITRRACVNRQQRWATASALPLCGDCVPRCQTHWHCITPGSATASVTTGGGLANIINHYHQRVNEAQQITFKYNWLVKLEWGICWTCVTQAGTSAVATLHDNASYY